MSEEQNYPDYGSAVERHSERYVVTERFMSPDKRAGVWERSACGGTVALFLDEEGEQWRRVAKLAPEKPSADRVTTENMDWFFLPKDSPVGAQAVMLDDAKRAIRANVERETKGLRKELDELRAWKKIAMSAFRQWDKVSREVDAQLGPARLGRGHAEVTVDLLRGRKADVDRLTDELAVECGGRHRAEAEVERMGKELDDAKAANREQRRKGAMDAAAWLEADGMPIATDRLRAALKRGEVLRDGEKQESTPICNRFANFSGNFDLRAMGGEVLRDGGPAPKQERAPEKTGRLPMVGDIVFVCLGSTKHWELRRVDGTDVPSGRFSVDRGGWGSFGLDNECVLWLWPTPGMG